MSLSKAAEQDHHTTVSNYYGNVLQSTSDLKTSACCPIGVTPPAEHQAILSKLHPEVTSRFYGCGSPIPPKLQGATVLDLGCGTGRDVYLLSGLVGPSGKVIGIDMTEKMLGVARRWKDYHAEKLLGSKQSNVEFMYGYIEDLRAVGIESESIDVVVSNCVCNLSPNKPAVFAEIARVLKPGGELYFSDIYADRRLTPAARADPELIGECLGGALYIHDFDRMLRSVHLSEPRIVSAYSFELHESRLRALVPDVKFYSVTVRAFKVDGVAEAQWEDFGQTAEYNGPEEAFELDTAFRFRKGIDVPVDGNTAEILARSRYRQWFNVTKKGVHRGRFRPEIQRGAVSFMMEEGLKEEGLKEEGLKEAVEKRNTSAETAGKERKATCGASGNKEGGCCGNGKKSQEKKMKGCC